MNYCSKCGEKYEKTTKFCTNCGTENTNLVENSSVRKNKKSSVLIGGIVLFLVILIYFVLFYSEFSDITGTWAEEEVPADVARIIISKDGNLNIIAEAFEGTEISMDYELETNGKDIYQTTGMSTIQFSVPKDSELIDMEDIQEGILDGIFEGIVPERKVKDGMIIYSIKIDGDNTNSYIAKLAANDMTIEYLEDNSIDLITLNSYSTETVQLNRVD